MMPHKVAASSIHGEPRNTSCAVDCASRVGSLGGESGRALSEYCGGPSFDCSGPISGIQKGNSMTGLLSPRQGEHWRWPYPSLGVDKSKSGLAMAMAMKSSRFDTGVKLWLKKDLPPPGEDGRLLSPAALSVPNYGVPKKKKRKKESLTLESNTGDEGRSADSTPGGKEVAPTKTGAKDGKENSPRINAVRNTSP